jgi:pimeloyl-ACP methyl ester carboxylesterase
MQLWPPEMSRVIGQVSVPAEVALPRVTKPVLLIYGERDALVRHSATVSLAKKLMPHANSHYHGAGMLHFSSHLSGSMRIWHGLFKLRHSDAYFQS